MFSIFIAREASTCLKMPCLRIITNLSQSKIPNDFVNKILPVLSKVMNKPESIIICAITGGSTITFGGQSTVPSAVATLDSIGLGTKDNKNIAKEVSAFVEKELGIKQDFFFLQFNDVQAQNVAKGGVTFA